MCVYIYIYIHIHAYLSLYIYIYTYSCTHVIAYYAAQPVGMAIQSVLIYTVSARYY